MRFPHPSSRPRRFMEMAPDGGCRPPSCRGKNHPGMTPFGYCLVTLLSATLLRETMEQYARVVSGLQQ